MDHLCPLINKEHLYSLSLQYLPEKPVTLAVISDN